MTRRAPTRVSAAIIAAVALAGTGFIWAAPAGAVTPPALTATGTTVTTAAPGASTPITGLSLSGDTDDTLQVTVSTDVGTLSMGETANLTLAYGYTTFADAADISFTGTEADDNLGLASLSLAPGATTGQTAHISLSAFVSEANIVYSPSNQHFYQYVNDPGVSWPDAQAAAATATYGGQTGYLATLPDAAVNTFVADNISGADNIWFGAHAFTDYPGYPRVWEWTDGPLQGGVISICSTLEASCDFVTGTSGEDGQPYSSWNRGEPNNSGYDPDVPGSGEDSAVTNWGGVQGFWNDLPTDNPGASGYLVEFGDQAVGSSVPPTGTASSTSPVLIATVPGAPTGLSDAPGDTTATLSFTPPADSGSPITGYDVSTDGGTTWAALPTTGTSPVTASLTGLTDGDVYSLAVRADNALGLGAPSGAIPLLPVAPPGAPGPPTVTDGDTQVMVTVTPPTTGGSPVTYTVTAIDSTNAGDGGQTCTVTGSSGSCPETGLTDGDSYTFTTTATDAVGTSPVSAPSAAVTPTLTPGIPGPPTVVAGDTQATVTVTAPTTGGTPTSYTVTAVDSTHPADGGQTCTVTGPTGSCPVTGLTAGDSYTFTVTATDAGGTSSSSLPSAGVIPVVDAPGTPGVPTVVAGDTLATVTVTAPTAGGTPASYTVTAVDSTHPAGGGQTCTVTVPSGSCTVTGLTPGDSYTFTVTATDAGGTSGSSPPSAAVTPTGPPVVAGSKAVGVTHPAAGGYLVVTKAGNVDSHDTAWLGSPHASGVKLGSPVVGIAAEADGGYLVVTAAGSVYNYKTPFYGSPHADRVKLGSPVVGIAAGTRNGYLLVTAAGRVYAYHTALFGPSGSDGVKLPSPVVGITSTATGAYLIVTRAGNIYAHGTAWYGSPAAKGVKLNSGIVGITAEAHGGYVALSAKGNVYNYGTAWIGSPYASGVRLVAPAAAITATRGDGYTLATSKGALYRY